MPPRTGNPGPGGETTPPATAVTPGLEEGRPRRNKGRISYKEPKLNQCVVRLVPDGLQVLMSFQEVA